MFNWLLLMLYLSSQYYIFQLKFFVFIAIIVFKDHFLIFEFYFLNLKLIFVNIFNDKIVHFLFFHHNLFFKEILFV
jgi:hypothetical protein